MKWEMYRGKPRLVRPHLFTSLEGAKRWLRQPLDPQPPPIPYRNNPKAKQRRSSEWRDPVPVCWREDYPGPAFAEDRFRDFLRPDDLSEFPEISRTTRNLQIVKKSYPWITCYLADDWRFDQIAEAAESGPGRRFQGRKVTGPAKQILRVVYDLEDSLYARDPDVSHDAVRCFWRSWQVYEHVREFAETDLAKDPNVQSLTATRNLSGVMEQARFTIWNQLYTYVLNLPPVRPTNEDSAETNEPDPPSSPQKRARRGPKPVDPKYHEKLVEIVDRHGGPQELSNETVLKKVAKDLNREEVPIPHTWPRESVRSWSRQAGEDPEKCCKVIRARYKRHKQQQPS